MKAIDYVRDYTQDYHHWPVNKRGSKKRLGYFRRLTAEEQYPLDQALWNEGYRQLVSLSASFTLGDNEVVYNRFKSTNSSYGELVVRQKEVPSKRALTIDKLRSEFLDIGINYMVKFWGLILVEARVPAEKICDFEVMLEMLIRKEISIRKQDQFFHLNVKASEVSIGLFATAKKEANITQEIPQECFSYFLVDMKNRTLEYGGKSKNFTGSCPIKIEKAFLK